MNEAETRAEYIDPALVTAGWGRVEGSRILREFSITQGRLQGAGKRGRVEIADYVLVYRNIQLAVIEAKAWSKPYTEGLAQAKGYAQRLAVRFAYATNGQKIYQVDMETGCEGDISHYPSPQELWDATSAQANVWCDRFTAIPFEDKGGSWQLRYYQNIAVRRVLEAISHGRNRILLALATGTGKTAIAFQVAWKLFHSRWNLKDWKHEGAEPTRRPRILFLTDRNILADQAFNTFSAFPEGGLIRINPEEIRKKGCVPKNGSIFFTIFQTFMSGPSEENKPSPYFGAYASDFFDLIIIDECHRGGANDESSWRDILNYFTPAVQLGLTATPKRTINADTYAYFGDPVYVYSLKDGIRDGFLTPFKVVQIATTIDDYVYMPDDDVISGEVEQGKRYEEKDFNRTIKIKEREEYRVKKFMELINQQEKTLVFCANQEHALMIRDLINQCSRSNDPNYCHRVTADDGAIGEQWLRDFQDNEKTIPTLLTTSQKLSTGVDARNIRNIVLLRPINSIIEFKQIIGRGTRLYEGKDYFTVYDFVKAHTLFNDSEWDGEPLEPKSMDSKLRFETLYSSAEQQPLTVQEKSPALYQSVLEIKLADGKQRTIQSMMATSFWGADGKPISAAQFLENLFGILPKFFKDEDQLREVWSDPSTRKSLLENLADKGFNMESLKEIQKLIKAEESDIYDVLAYVAFASSTQTRITRADYARIKIQREINNSNQQIFINFVLDQYMNQGVDELAESKLPSLLNLKYGGINDAITKLGDVAQIRQVFISFQHHLYEPRV
ncbi:EcoAI/FtnUII family type I restriction enzme subunit R [Candidatus Nitrosacidococcus sp. I8]|uniref:EcoAI/FtnUII family type I restriction enzme subunit R n=1 Tax=Candidatus Nitrosacidococcus sp. I8 TaxID=2942908 RepID=UPI0022267A97|nr:type I restriction endonuclease subunit R [Candidatus Nitrosacidococcus sp. I8]CAH9018189.1 hypothetical protein NURINAE_00782 [Candidatus Nitrosacidococcus sp. I8]